MCAEVETPISELICPAGSREVQGLKTGYNEYGLEAENGGQGGESRRLAANL